MDDEPENQRRRKMPSPNSKEAKEAAYLIRSFSKHTDALQKLGLNDKNIV